MTQDDRAVAMLRFTLWLLVLAPLAGARPAADPADRIVILVSIDGWRWDYLERYPAPRLQALADAGVLVERLIPPFPSRTFPSHYSLVTGLRAERHGIVGNDMYDPESGLVFRSSNPLAVADPRWWQGEPIWVTAERQGRRSACMFWPGSEAAIDGVRPTYWHRYRHNLPGEDRVRQVLDWLDLPPEHRPVFITLYFAEVDDAGHRHGPDSEDTERALLEVDGHLGALVDGITARGLDDRVHLVIVSDHGMTAVSPERVLFLDDVIPLEEVQIDFTGPMVGVRPLGWSIDRCVAALQKLPHVRVMRKTDLSPALGYANHARVPDLLVLADEGWRIYTRAQWARNGNRDDGGEHGYEPTYGSMAGAMVAWGAGYRRGCRIQAADNIHVYALLCETLGLDPAPHDGDERLARAVLAD
jgi:predicted AlkP superfamily pyrophosphatase or phosphodiesterase